MQGGHKNSRSLEKAVSVVHSVSSVPSYTLKIGRLKGYQYLLKRRGSFPTFLYMIYFGSFTGSRIRMASTFMLRQSIIKHFSPRIKKKSPRKIHLYSQNPPVKNRALLFLVQTNGCQYLIFCRHKNKSRSSAPTFPKDRPG